jgi:hypothetical protein
MQVGKTYLLHKVKGILGIGGISYLYLVYPIINKEIRAMLNNINAYLDTLNFGNTLHATIDMIGKGMNDLGLTDKVARERILTEMVTVLTSSTIELVNSIYTQEELDAIIAFYSTPIGKQLAKKNPAMAQAVGDITNEVMKKCFHEIDMATWAQAGRAVDESTGN